MESKDSVAALEAGRREEDQEGYKMDVYNGEDADRREEWFQQARM